MPVYSRAQLRRDLGQDFLADTTLGTTVLSLGVGGAAQFMDPVLAALSFSGQQIAQRAWVYHAAGAQTFRVGSFNTASGAYVSGNLTFTSVASGDLFEVHELSSPADKNRAIDNTLQRIPLRQEVGFPAVTEQTRYVIDGAASPHALRNVLNAYYVSNPAATTHQDRHDFVGYEIITTATGTELRIAHAVASAMLYLDAVLDLTLGAADTATINLPSERWLLAGAAAQLLGTLIQRSPGQEAGRYKERRAEHVQAWNRLTAKFSPPIVKRIRFDENPGF